MNNKMTHTEEIAYKMGLFQDADFYHLRAVEDYELADALESKDVTQAEYMREEARDFDNRFQSLLDFLMTLGWDKEYMGIA